MEPEGPLLETSDQRGIKRKGSDDTEEHVNKSARTTATASASPGHAEKRGSDVLTLYIGGEKIIQTTRSTLTVAAGSKLAETFSGRWDDSLPKDSKGHFFIDHDHEIFISFFKFLRVLNATAPPDDGQVPPLTPSYDDPMLERAFRRMVDGYDLTNVLYNYEIYEHPHNTEVWNKQLLVSYKTSILDFGMAHSSGDDTKHFTLDRPISLGGPTHTRKIQSFEVVIDHAYNGLIGWIRRDAPNCKDANSFNDEARRVALALPTKTLHFVNQHKEWKFIALQKCQATANSLIRCTKHRRTGELEWYVDGTLVIATFAGLEIGTTKTITVGENTVQLLGWSVPDGYEMKPCLSVQKGSCRFVSVQLEN